MCIYVNEFSDLKDGIKNNIGICTDHYQIIFSVYISGMHKLKVHLPGGYAFGVLRTSMK